MTYLTREQLSPFLNILTNKETQISIPLHTIQNCKKMAGQNAFQILLLNDANMIGEY